MPISSRFDTEMRQRLPKAAEILAGAMRTKAPTNKIKGAISVGQVMSTAPGSYHIDVIIDMKRAPEARAYEYGSGIHASKNPGTYPIRPKNAKALAFNWPGHSADFPRGGKYIGPAPDGRLMFTFVDHPGVAKRPYVKPALQEKASEIYHIIGRAFRVSIASEMREVFEIGYGGEGFSY